MREKGSVLSTRKVVGVEVRRRLLDMIFSMKKGELKLSK